MLSTIASGLPLARGLFAQYVALAVERRRRHRGDVEIERVGGRDMHRQLPPERRQRVAWPPHSSATSTPILPRPGASELCI